MTFRTIISVCCRLLILALAMVLDASPAAAQESVGFADPADLQALLDYRLPDWGYRTWDATIDLRGQGTTNHSGSGARRTAFQRWQAETNLQWNRFGEDRDWSVAAEGIGVYDGYRASDFSSDQDQHLLEGTLHAQGDATQYVGGGPFSIGGELFLRTDYSEDIRHVVFANGTIQDKRYVRDRGWSISLGPGIGRMRNVVPILRAQRLSERLQALGRPPLTRTQVAAVAAVLAREGGYRQVYERPDREFWRDVLEPMLEPGRPLAPYEIYYLRDVLVEDFGNRRQGERCAVSGSYADYRHDVAGHTETTTRIKGVRVSAVLNRNLSLQHQVGLTLAGAWSRFGDSDDALSAGTVSWALGHEWNVADRVRISSQAQCEFRYEDYPDVQIRRRLTTELASDARFRVEDAVALVVGLAGGYGHVRSSVDRQDPAESWSDTWSWEYSLSLEYVLDRFLY